MNLRRQQVIVLMAPTAIANTGWKIYILFILMSMLGFPFVYFFLPEVRLSRRLIVGRHVLTGCE